MSMTRYFFFFGLILFSCLAAKGDASAGIYLPLNPSPLEWRMAGEFASHWERMTGEVLEIRCESAAPPWRSLPPRHAGHGLRRPAPRRNLPPEFFLGETRAAQSLVPIPGGLDRDGFVIRSSGNRMVLRGATPEAVPHAVYHFLHLMGARWYWPTELGEHLPEISFRGMPHLSLVKEPAFLSRQVPARTEGFGRIWEERNMLRPRHRFHHNLSRIFTEEVYQRHPEFFILLNGKRVRPDDRRGGYNYQICFANPEAARFAARAAGGFFDRNPGETSFSLGMNDTFPMCECPLCREWVDSERVFRGRPDYSDLIFLFMNRAAEALRETHPDRYLGCLAYYFAENVPSFPVHPKVIPFLTADRFQWHDRDFRKEDKDLIMRWCRAGPEKIGIYDYYYGSAFAIPRVFPSMTADSLRHAASAGVSGFYAELYPVWPLDGPKAWLLARLLWEPEADADWLLDQFYSDFFGPAADPMRRFYERAEEIWKTQGDPAFWLKFYHDFTQLELYPPPVCREMRGFLEQAMAIAPEGLHHQRVELVSQAFRQTENYSRYYFAAREKPAEGAAALMDWIRNFLQIRAELEEFDKSVIQRNRLLRPHLRLSELARFLPGMAGGAVAADLREEVQNDPALKAEALALVMELEEAIPESRARLAWESHGAVVPARNRLRNGAFVFDQWASGAGQPTGDPDYTPFFWERWGGETGKTVARLCPAFAREGRLSFRFEGSEREILHQGFPVEPGNSYLAQAHAKGRISPGSRVEIRIDWLDSAGRRIETDPLSLSPVPPGQWDDWRRLRVFATAPPEAAAGVFCLVVYHQAEGDAVHFDDAGVWEISPVG